PLLGRLTLAKERHNLAQTGQRGWWEGELFADYAVLDVVGFSKASQCCHLGRHNHRRAGLFKLSSRADPLVPTHICVAAIKQPIHRDFFRWKVAFPRADS